MTESVNLSRSCTVEACLFRDGEDREDKDIAQWSDAPVSIIHEEQKVEVTSKPTVAHTFLAEEMDSV